MPEDSSQPIQGRKTILVFALVSLIILVLASIVLFFILSQNKVKQTSNKINSTKNEAKSSLSEQQVNEKGVSFSPKSMGPIDFSNFFSEAKKVGNIVTWAGAWEQIGDSKKAPFTIATLAERQKLTPVIIASYSKQMTNSNQLEIPPSDSKTRQLYADAAATFATKFHPKYLGLGVEINRMEKQSAAAIDNFAQVFDLSVKAVKEVSPETKIFTVFQLEEMKGLNGGLFGGINDTTKNQWSILSKFASADFFAFTTYPDLIYKNPFDVPSDYYTDIKNHTEKPVAFTEIGWPSATPAVGWDSSQEKQAAFVTKFFELTHDLKPVMSIWPFLYDPLAKEPFTSMGLIDKNGVEKQAYQTWINSK